jgi:predicted DNA-binding protein (UPF0251 family)
MPIIIFVLLRVSLMPRPRCCRKISGRPLCALYSPGGISTSSGDAVSLTLDEFEALRLADFEGLYQEDAAGRMTISRQTFGRIIESAHRKVAQALIEAKVLRIGDGEFRAAERRSFLCDSCPHKRVLASETGQPAGCPRCQGGDVRREDQDKKSTPKIGSRGRRGNSTKAPIHHS